MMKKTWFMTATLACLLAGCAADATDSVTAALSGSSSIEHEGWTLTANEPVLVDKGIIQGSATFERSSGAEQRGGGVCLVADLSDGLSCQSDAHCAEQLGAPPTGGYHYCVAAAGAAAKTCWTRPSNNCIRSVTLPGGVLDPGTYTTRTESVRINGKKVKWRTLGCIANTSNVLGCGSADSSESVKVTSHLLGDDQ
jgi:hypothetical protein